MNRNPFFKKKLAGNSQFVFLLLLAFIFSLSFIDTANAKPIIIGTSADNVGIGTTAPGAKLQIHKAFTSSGLYEGPDLSWSTDNGSASWYTGQITGYIDAGVNNSNANYPGGLLFKTKAADGSYVTLPTTKMVLDAAGNVGIGTTGPGYKLDVNGTIQANSTFRTPNVAFWETGRSALNSGGSTIDTSYGWMGTGGSNSETFLHITGFASPSMVKTTGDMPAPYGVGFGNGSESGGIMPIGAGDNLQEIMFYGSNSGPTTFTWKHQVWDGANNGYSAAAMSLNANSGQLYVAGNVGIGTTNPTTAKLVVTPPGNNYSIDVAGGRIGNLSSVMDTDAATVSYVKSAAASAAASAAGSTWTVSGSNIYNSNSGSVGIGAVSPSTKLHVAGTLTVDPGNTSNYSEGIRIASATNGYSILQFGANPAVGTGAQANQWWLGKDGRDNGFNIWNTSSGDVFHILSSGNVGIGSTAPSADLDINGKVKITSGGTIYNADSSRWLDMTGTLTDSLRVSGNIITTTGNVGIGMTTPRVKLQVSGPIGSTNLAGSNLVEYASNMAAYNGNIAQLAFIDGKTISALNSPQTGSGSCYEWGSSSMFPVNPNADYEYSIWTQANGIQNIYMGFYVYDSNGTQISSGSLDNPYFHTGSEQTNGSWKRLIGYLRSSGTPKNSNYTAVTSSVKSTNTNSIDWVMPSNAAYAMIRWGSCYGGTGTTGRVYMYLPSVKEVNHDENYENINVVDNNVGIGTTAPADKLHVAGNATISGIAGCTGTGSAIKTDASGRLVCGTIAGGVTGLGTANYVARWTGTNTLGTGVLYDNGTNVGIGTTAPAQKLWVSSGSIWMTGDGNKLAFSTDGSTDTTPNASIIALQNGISGASADLIFNTWSGSVDTEIMRLRSNGNVGIGTTNPVNGKLEVNGNITVGGGSSSNWASINAGGAQSINAAGSIYSYNSVCASNGSGACSGSGGVVIGLANSSASTNFPTSGNSFINNGSNVGIGTTGPAGKLNINETTGTAYGAAQGSLIIDHANGGGASSVVFRSATNRGSDFGFMQYQDAATVGGAGESARLIIGTSNDADDHLLLMPAGNVGIGSATPAAKLDVSGTGQFTQPVIVGSPTATNHAATKSYVDSAVSSVWTTSGTSIYNSNSGNIGIGTASPAAKLHLESGDLVLSNGTYYNSAGARYGGKISLFSSLKGRQVNDNPDFMEGLSGYNVYDNAGSGTVSLSIVSDSTAPSASGRVMRISVSAAGATPGFGGFNKGTALCGSSAVGHCMRQGNRHVVRIWAKIPVGSSITWASNSMGTGGSFQWISSTAGTGNWEEYIGQETMGSGANNTNFFYIIGGTPPFTWDVASVDIIDIDSPADVDRASSLNVGYKNDVVLNTGDFLTTSDSYLATDGGNVGIGTTAPAATLDVNGSVYIEGGLGIYQRVSGTNKAYYGYSSGQAGIQLYNFTSGQNFMMFDSGGIGITGGNVGIGTTASASALDVYGKTRITSGGTIYNSDSTRWLDLSGSLGDSLRVSANLITTGGKIGVGTTAPGGSIHVASADVTDTPRGDIVMSRYWSSSSNARASSIFHYYDSSLGSDRLAIGVAGGGGNYSAPNTIANAKMVVTAAGNVGIGTLNPGYRLDVYGSARIQGANNGIYLPSGNGFFQNGSDSWIRTIGSGSIWAGGGLFGADGGLTIGYGGGTPPSTGAIISGAVGIGTNSPSNKLHIKEISQTEFYGSDIAKPTSNLLLEGSGSSRTVGTGPAITFAFPANTDGTNIWSQARILATPDNASNGNAVGRLYLQVRDNYNPGTGGSWNWRTGLMIAGSGNVGIGTTNPISPLQVNGEARATAFAYDSDRNLKYNINTIDNALAKILKLRGVTFNWKNDDTKSVGLIAQEVEQVFPELVSGTEGHKGVEYGNLVGPLIEAVKEQQKEIDNLQHRILILEKKAAKKTK